MGDWRPAFGFGMAILEYVSTVSAALGSLWLPYLFPGLDVDLPLSWF